MKKKLLLVLIIICVSSILSWGQKALSGKYLYSYGSAVEGQLGTSIEFLPDHTFNYYAYSCLSHVQGKGKYSIDKDFIRLMFKQDDSLESSYRTVKTAAVNNKVRYDLKLRYEDSAEAHMPELISVTISGSARDSFFLEGFDENGNFSFETNASAGTIIFDIGAGDHKPVKVSSTLLEGGTSEIFLAKHCMDCIDLPEIKYRINSISKKQLILKDGDNVMKFLKRN